MLDYRDCSIGDFNAAMEKKNDDVKDISNAHLFILYTKFKADAATCFHAGTSYASGLGIRSENHAEMYKKELQNRGVLLT